MTSDAERIAVLEAEKRQTDAAIQRIDKGLEELPRKVRVIVRKAVRREVKTCRQTRVEEVTRQIEQATGRQQAMSAKAIGGWATGIGLAFWGLFESMKSFFGGGK